MGDVYATLGIWAADGSYLRNLRVQADTGASYSQLPNELLREMGWTPTQAPRPSTLADGSEVAVELGEVKVRYNGDDLTRIFVFGEEKCRPLMGSDTLQGFGLGVDPVNHTVMAVVMHR
jgi:predicted aspartyl protease